VNDKGEPMPFAKIAVFRQGTSEAISLNVTDEKGFVMITSEYMLLTNGDTLKFVVFSENYTKVEKSIQFNTAIKEYNLTLVTAIAKTLTVTFKIKGGCPAGLEKTLIVLFSKHERKAADNMTNC
jgi:hypothetical protein